MCSSKLKLAKWDLLSVFLSKAWCSSLVLIGCTPGNSGFNLQEQCPMVQAEHPSGCLYGESWQSCEISVSVMVSKVAARRGKLLRHPKVSNQCSFQWCPLATAKSEAILHRSHHQRVCQSNWAENDRLEECYVSSSSMREQDVLFPGNGP